ncbi:unnamed protein product [Meganyctiphanes norvegica]|uniref:Uncharacterized protein n=1 Tax=Meganyctiphanes norvegica TaxID=48144 RepID=A0AAV2REP1_MEGNR
MSATASRIIYWSARLLLVIVAIVVFLYALNVDMIPEQVQSSQFAQWQKKIGQTMKLNTILKTMNTVLNSSSRSSFMEDEEFKEDTASDSHANINLPRNPNLNRSCYQYQNLEANNTCCETKVYKTIDIHTCAAKESAIIRQFKDFNISSKPENDKKSHWVFVGNSRIRKLFGQIQLIFSGVGGAQFVRPRRRHQTLKVGHRTVPLNLTCFWDPLLHDLPWRVNRWLKYPHERPTRIHIGVGVNFMKDSRHIYDKSGQETAGKAFQRAVARVVPDLQKLTKFIPISWWTSEHVLQKKVYPKYRNVWSHSNIKYYNDILIKQLHGTDIAVMDAHMPLGQLFLKSCTDNFKNDNKRCHDHVHQGSRAFRQYAMMLLNHACNAHFIDDYMHHYCA